MRTKLTLVVMIVIALLGTSLLLAPANRAEPSRQVSDEQLVTRVRELQASVLDATKDRLAVAKAGLQKRDRIITAQRDKIEKLKDQLAARSSFQ